MKITKSVLEKIRSLSRRNKIIGIVVILFVLFLLLRGRNKAPVLTFATVSRNNISSSVSASGVLSGKNIASLHFNEAGTLNYLPFTNGASVVKGQVVASLNSIILNSAYQEALNNRRNTQAALASIYDQLNGDTSTETFAQKATRTAAEVANDNAYDALKAAQKALNDTVLIAPISGIIVNENNINIGQNIMPTDIIAQVVDFSRKYFDATVDESDIGSIQIGQNANITLNAYGEREFQGKVTEIEPATQTDATGAITITVKIEVDDPAITKIYGLNGNANIITASETNVLTIPQDALIDNTHVYIKGTNGKAEKREIVTGIKSDTDVEVISGLTVGDQVVTNPANVK